MKAIVQDRYGPPDVLQLKEIDPPTPGPGEILVRVHAAAANAYDWHVMRGDPYLARLSMGLSAPRAKVRGRDFAGRVEAVAAGVTRFAPGDEVFGDLGTVDGAFAEYAVVPDEGVETKPANLTFEQAAAIPLAGQTALKGLRDVARVRAGQQVLIIGASGGVGTFAVQIAKHLGAEVTAVCSTRNVDLVTSLGADHVIDYTKTDFRQAPERYDVVFDLAGTRSFADCRRALTPEGTLVLSGGGNSEGGSLLGPMGLIFQAKLRAPFLGQRVLLLSTAQNRAILTSLRELAESGAITPVIDRTYKLPEVPDAIRHLEVDHARGKVVITV